MTENYCQNGRIGPRNSGLVPSIFFLREGSSLEPVPKPDYELIAKLEEWPLDLAIKVMHDVAGDIAEDFRFETGFGSNYSFNQVREVALQAIGAKKLKSKICHGTHFLTPRSWINWFKETFYEQCFVLQEPLQRIALDKQAKNRISDNLSRENTVRVVNQIWTELRLVNPDMNKSQFVRHPRVVKVADKRNGVPYQPSSIYKMIDGKAKSGRPSKSKGN